MYYADNSSPIDILIAPSHPPVITADAPALDGIVALIVKAATLELVGLLGDGNDRVLGSMSLGMADLLRARRKALLVGLDPDDVKWARQISIGNNGPVEEISIAHIKEIGISLAHENVSMEGLRRKPVLSNAV